MFALCVVLLEESMVENLSPIFSDIKECEQDNGGCDHICTESEGSFQCSCRSGFNLESDGRSCSDIDECSAGSHNCEQRCTNTEGSFTCGCNSGLTLNSDGRTCTGMCYALCVVLFVIEKTFLNAFRHRRV